MEPKLVEESKICRSLSTEVPSVTPPKLFKHPVTNIVKRTNVFQPLNASNVKVVQSCGKKATTLQPEPRISSMDQPSVSNVEARPKMAVQNCETVTIESNTFATTTTDVLEQFRLTKYIEYNSASRDKLLQTETDLLAMTKAKEHIKIQNLECHLQEGEERFQQLQQEIDKSKKCNEELKHALERENLCELQLVKQFNNIREIIEILGQHGETVRKDHEDQQQEAETLEKKLDELLQHYREERKEIMKDIQETNDTIQDLQKKFEQECAEEEVELIEKNEILTKVKEELNESKRLHSYLHEQNESVKNQLEKNKNTLNELQYGNEDVRSTIQNIELKESELFQEMQGWHYEDDLLEMNNELSQANEAFERLQRERVALNEMQNTESNKTNELGAQLLAAKNEISALSVIEQDLNRNIENVTTELVEFSELKDSKLQEFEGTMNDYNDQINDIDKGIEEKQNYINVGRQENETAQVQLSQLYDTEAKLNDEVQTQTQKITSVRKMQTDLEVEINSCTLMFQQASDHYEALKRKTTDEIIKLNEKVSEAENQLKKIKDDNEIETQKLQDELADYKIKAEKVDYNNQEMHQKKLHELKCRLEQHQVILQSTKDRIKRSQVEVNKKRDQYEKLMREKEEFSKIDCKTSSQKGIFKYSQEHLNTSIVTIAAGESCFPFGELTDTSSDSPVDEDGMRRMELEYDNLFDQIKSSSR